MKNLGGLFKILLLFFCLFLSTHIISVSCLNSDGLTLLSLLKHLDRVPPQVTSTWKINASEATPCNWFGITCDDSKNVASLNFTRSRVSGQLGPEIGELKSLQILDLSTNNFSGTIPSTLGNCTKLATLDLSENGFSDKIPDTLDSLKRLEVLYLYINFLTGLSRCVVMAVQGGRGYESPWDEKPYETLPTGKRVYVDESDVVTFLDPPKELIPLDPASYNPAAYLWKKIEDIPEERRHHLLQLLEPRLISRAWEIASTRYEDPKLAKMTASKIFSAGNAEIPVEYFSCRTSQGPLIISWINFFKMALFRSYNGQIYGRVCGGPVVSTLANAFSPLYFEVTEAMEVMATEEPCDVACKFGDGLLAIEDYPQGFPRPAKHPYPFNDSVVIYIRHIGPGVCVGQAWQEGRELQQVPQRLCSDILMVKQYR